MKIATMGRGLRLALGSAALLALSACATAPAEHAAVPQVDDPAPARNAADSAPIVPRATPNAVAPAPSSTATELQALIQARQVTELRTVYNGSYGASLLFDPQDQRYFVALFQNRDFWRVIKTPSFPQAETVYRAFAQQTVELAAVDIERVRLQAEYAQAEQQLAARRAELSALQADQAQRLAQEQQVAARQAQGLQETEALNQQNQDAHMQLRSLERQIDQLQTEQAELQASRKR